MKNSGAHSTAPTPQTDDSTPQWPFDFADRYIIIALASIILIAVGLFFLFVFTRNLISYPDGRIAEAIQSGSFEYFAYALEYRERRLSLALTYRTFITTFGFTIGLILSAVGGIFILRRSVVAFDLAASTGSGVNPPVGDSGGVTPPEPSVVSIPQRLAASLATNSPGVLFMIGGIIVMVVTQLLAIPVGSPEIFPPPSVVRCDKGQMQRNECYLFDASTPTTERAEKVLSFCEAAPSSEGCSQLNQLIEDLE